MPVEIDIASEFRYRDPVLDARSLVIGISQSGETIDTLAAMAYAKTQGANLIGVSNVIDSALARESDSVLYTRAGLEIGVAATKSFTTQLVVMQLLGLYLAQVRSSLEHDEITRLVREISRLPENVELALKTSEQVERLAVSWLGVRDFFFLGRAGDFPVAMEGALKLKEIAYVRAEGYAAGEMKHGPIALVEEGVVIVGVACDSHVRAKTLSNLEEMKARGGSIIAGGRGRRRGRRRCQPRHPDPFRTRSHMHRHFGGAAATLRISRGDSTRTRRRQAQESGEDGHGRVESSDDLRGPANDPADESWIVHQVPLPETSRLLI